MADRLTDKEKVERLDRTVADYEAREKIGLSILTADARFLLDRIAKLEEAPEEKKPAKPLSFDDWLKSGEVSCSTREDAWNASRRNTKKDMSMLLRTNDFREAALWLEEYNWGTSDE